MPKQWEYFERQIRQRGAYFRHRMEQSMDSATLSYTVRSHNPLLVTNVQKWFLLLTFCVACMCTVVQNGSWSKFV